MLETLARRYEQTLREKMEEKRRNMAKEPAEVIVDPSWDFWTDGSVIEGGFGGAAWVTRNPIEGGPPLGFYYTIRKPKDVTTTELTGILKAFEYVVGRVGSQLHTDFSGLYVTVWSDCMDAVDELRYAREPADGFIRLHGKHRVGYITVAHPDLTYGILRAIRSLEARGISARVCWRERMSCLEAVKADTGAKEGSRLRCLIAGSSTERACAF